MSFHVAVRAEMFVALAEVDHAFDMILIWRTCVDLVEDGLQAGQVAGGELEVVGGDVLL